MLIGLRSLTYSLLHIFRIHSRPTPVFYSFSRFSALDLVSWSSVYTRFQGLYRFVQSLVPSKLWERSLDSRLEVYPT